MKLQQPERKLLAFQPPQGALGDAFAFLIAIIIGIVLAVVLS